MKSQGMRNLEVKRLYVYPIKSCGGIGLQSSTFNERGLLYDRHWAIVDANTHKVVTARQKPEMTMIQTSFITDPSAAIDSQPTHLRISIPSFVSEPTEYPELSYCIPLDLASQVKRKNIPRSSSTTSLNSNDSDVERDGGESFSDVEIWGVATDGIVIDSPRPILTSQSSLDEDIGSLTLSDALTLYLSQEVLVLAKGPNLLRRLGDPGIINSPGILRYITDYVWPQGAKESKLLKKKKRGKNGETGLWETGSGRIEFADDHPFHLAGWESFADIVKRRKIEQRRYQIGQGSVANLNIDVGEAEIEEMVKRFRPNILVGGVTSDDLEPWEEDGWLRIEIEGVNKDHWMEIGFVMRCGRCPIPNINPLTGIPDSSPRNNNESNEPIADMTRLLAPFRKVDKLDNSPCVGIKGVPREDSGAMAIGSSIRILSASTTRRADGFFARPEDNPFSSSFKVTTKDSRREKGLHFLSDPLSIFHSSSSSPPLEYRSLLKMVWIVALAVLFRSWWKREEAQEGEKGTSYSNF